MSRIYAFPPSPNANRWVKESIRPLSVVHRPSAIVALLLAAALLNACQPVASAVLPPIAAPQTPVSGAAPTPTVPKPVFTERPRYQPGELVEYTAQNGDTLPALAAHFNTTVGEIMQANPIIPASATTLPPGLPMKIPIYYLPFWGTQFQMLPDALFVNGPAQVGFDTAAFVAERGGWLAGYREYISGASRSGAEVVELAALNYSLSPQLLLALLEFRSGALSQPTLVDEWRVYPLGYLDWQHKGLYMQLAWAANTLNNGYYGWRNGRMTEFEHPDGRLERPDPWQNAGTVGLQYLFSRLLPANDYAAAISPGGFADLYGGLYGDPWTAQAHIPGSLVQPIFLLPFEPGKPWTLTGGPHTSWGEGDPLTSLDFAPPSVGSGCAESQDWATAVGSGITVRSEEATVVLDLDDGENLADGDERTGWVLIYFHLATEDRSAAGLRVAAGDRLGHPSCEGGRATGTHIHIARKYNGEWIAADGAPAFDLGGWVAHNGSRPYLGSLTRFAETVIASESSIAASQIVRETNP